MLTCKLGIAPIAWWNDDLEELSDDVSLDECLRQAAEAGLTGMETGRRFPMNMEELGPVLDRHGMSVCGGWFSGLLLDGDIEAEKDRVAEQHAFFKAAGAPCIVYGETARSVQGERHTPLAGKPVLNEAEMAVYGRKVSDFADWCAAEGMPLAYHHHMAAAVETGILDAPQLGNNPHGRGQIRTTFDERGACISVDPETGKPITEKQRLNALAQGARSAL